MIRLNLFGAAELRHANGADARSVAIQPKRTALLACLALTPPPGACRRDTVLGLLWPELTETRARAALSKALHHLRQSLGSATVESRGDTEIALSWRHISCDAAEFRLAIEQGRHEAALELYRGELLQGFHLSDAPEFERWIDAERQWFRRHACDAAAALADKAETTDLDAALRYARRARELAPEDERLLRRIMTLLDRAGDRTAALAEFEAFSDFVRESYDVDPSPPTVALATSLRERHVSPASSPRTASAGDAVADAQYRAMLESLADLVVLIDAQGIIRYVSPAVQRVTGLQPHDMMDTTIWEYIHPDDVEYLRVRAASRLRGEGNPAAYTEVRMRHTDGFWRLLQLRGQQYVADSGAPMVLVAARDLTEVRAVERIRRDFTGPASPPGSAEAGGAGLE